MTEDEVVGWHHWLNGHEFEQALRVGDGQGGLACCSPWSRKESDPTEWSELNWTSTVGITGLTPGQGTRILHTISMVKKKKEKKLALIWTSPMVQWLRIHLPIQGTQVWSLAWKDTRKNTSHTTKPVHHNHWTHIPERLAPQQENLQQWEAAHCNGRVALLAATREGPHAATKTQHSQK